MQRGLSGSRPLPPRSLTAAPPSRMRHPPIAKIDPRPHPVAADPRAGRAGFWKRQARTWHWISGAICLLGMLGFAVTGITLNHAADIPAEPVVTERQAQLPEPLLAELAAGPEKDRSDALPPAVAAFVEEALDIGLSGRPAEWSPDEVYVGLPRPGGDAWLSIERESGAVLYERTTRGAIAYLNDLHKGRHTGKAWSWFLDIFSAACIVFCLTGLWLLQIHAGKRPSTWPLVVAGLALPVLLLVFFVHA